MIKQINISHMEKLEGLLEKALHEGYTHFVPYSNEIQIHQSMLKSIELPSTSFVVDYTYIIRILMTVDTLVKHILTLKIGYKILIYILMLFTKSIQRLRY